MDTLLAICQAIGLALAVGVGGPLAALFITVMACLHIGIDPRLTKWDFLGKIWFLFLVLISSAVALSLARSEDGPRRLARLGFATVFGAIAGAASLAENGDSAVFGLVIGALVGAGSGIVATDVLIGARRRAELSNLESKASAGNTLEGIFAVAGIVIAVFALFLPPLSLLGIVALAVLANGRRRKAGEKYEGLRVLR